MKNHGFSRFPKVSWEIWCGSQTTPQVVCEHKWNTESTRRCSSHLPAAFAANHILDGGGGSGHRVEIRPAPGVREVSLATDGEIRIDCLQRAGRKLPGAGSPTKFVTSVPQVRSHLFPR